MAKIRRVLCWSGGKDSSASIVVCYENNIHIDAVVMSEVMFDHLRNISGENPKHIKWVYEVAIPIIEKKFGYKVIIVKDKSDYIKEFSGKILYKLDGNYVKEFSGKILLNITYDQVKTFSGQIIAKFDTTYIKSFTGQIQYKLDGFLTRKQLMAILTLLYAS